MTGVLIDFIAPRLGLSECLEDYAHRLGMTPDEARRGWRVQGLLAIGATYASDGLCLIGGPVCCGPSLEEVLADD